MKRTIKLRSITEAKDFVALVSQFPEKMQLCGDETMVDAKSIMGLFCFDLAKPILRQIDADEERGREICQALGSFIEGRDKEELSCSKPFSQRPNI